MDSNNVNMEVLNNILGIEVKHKGQAVDEIYINSLSETEILKVVFHLSENKKINIKKGGEFSANITVIELKVYLNLGVKIIM